jgi:glycosyltransferase involved in cell wall biosynthesis
MHQVRLLEVVSGLGLGGAERALINRTKYLPPNFQQTVLNVRPEINSLKFDSKVWERQVGGRGLNRLIEIYKFLSQNQFDAVVVRTPLDAIRFGFFQFLDSTRAQKLIFEAHSNFVTQRRGLNLIMKSLFRCVSRKIDLVIAVSQSVSRGPLCKGQRNVEIVFLGAELEGLTELVRSSSTPRLLFIGRLVDLKRPVWLLERIVAIRHRCFLPSNALTMIGSGPLKKQVQDFILAFDLTGTVRYVGEQQNVTPYLLSATHLISCSTNEGLPLTFFEAKLAGLTVISTPSGGGAEIFDSQDHELESFESGEFEDVLVSIFTTPTPTLQKRKKIQADSRWMNASECASKYYQLVLQALTSEQHT